MLWSKAWLFQVIMAKKHQLCMWCKYPLSHYVLIYLLICKYLYEGVCPWGWKQSTHCKSCFMTDFSSVCMEFRFISVMFFSCTPSAPGHTADAGTGSADCNWVKLPLCLASCTARKHRLRWHSLQIILTIKVNGTEYRQGRVLVTRYDYHNLW